MRPIHRFATTSAAILVVLALLLAAPPSTGIGYEDPCEVCYTKTMCIPVAEGFGFRKCTPNITRYYKIPNIVDGGTLDIPYLVCVQEDRCVLGSQ